MALSVTMGLATLWTPFPSLTADNFLSRGSAGQVFAINTDIVFKCPTQFTDPAPEQAQESDESHEKIEREKSVYKVLMQNQHRNIVRAILCVSEGIFLQRLECTLQARLDGHAYSSISLNRQYQWIQQLASAMEWLERLGYVHGDLRPANILLDARDALKVGDFDSTVKLGEQLLVTTAPFCKLKADYEAPLAGPVSEQYAVGSCIYNIRTGHEPFHDIDGPVMVRKLMNNEFPSTLNDEIFGDIVIRCWRGSYQSISELEQVILTHIRDFCEQQRDATGVFIIQDCSKGADPTDQALVFECEAFLRQQRRRPVLKKMSEAPGCGIGRAHLEPLLP